MVKINADKLKNKKLPELYYRQFSGRFCIDMLIKLCAWSCRVADRFPQLSADVGLYALYERVESPAPLYSLPGKLTTRHLRFNRQII